MPDKQQVSVVTALGVFPERSRRHRRSLDLSLNDCHGRQLRAIKSRIRESDKESCRELDSAVNRFSTSVPLPGKRAKFSPKWDDLRGDARFEKIVASVAAPLKIE